jgi:hypothetical protein
MDRQPAAVGFVPVAIHFELFQTLVKIGKPLSVPEIVEAVKKNPNIKSPLRKFLGISKDIMTYID